MLQALLAGAIAGHAIAIPVGAIAVLIIHTGLTDGLRHGLATVGRSSGHRLRRPTVLLGNSVVLLLGALIFVDGARTLHP